MTRRLALPLICLLATLPQAAWSFPVTVTSCGREVTIEAPPRRAVSHGSNLTEIMLALGLEDRMAGFTGQGDRIRAKSAALFPAAAGLRELQKNYPSIEVLLAEEIDFFFAGWSYGMRIGGEVTPDSLARFGIPVYELSESCVRLGRREKPSLDYLYRDLTNLAAIFGVPERAAALIADYRRRVEAVARDVATRTRPRPTVFVYDSGERVAQSAGGYSMPEAIIDAAGGVNILHDNESSWVRVGWEAVVDRDPEVVVVVDYGEVTAEQKIAFMKSNPAFAAIRAVKNDRFLVLGYDDLTPGPRNISAIETLAAFLAAE